MATRPYYSSAPADDCYEITPNDSTDLTKGPGGWPVLNIGVAGDIAIVTAAGNSRTVTVVAGVFPVRVQRVLSTGTTATDIVALLL